MNLNMTLNEMIREAEIADNKIALAVYESLIEEGKSMIVELHNALDKAVDSIEYDINEVRTSLQEHFQPTDMLDRIVCLLDDEGVLTDENREAVTGAMKEYLTSERTSFNNAATSYLKKVELPADNVVTMHDEISTSSFCDVLEEESGLIFDKRGK
jgi:hypothetical protein